MKEIEPHLNENLFSKEVLIKTHFGGMTISGKSGTGKTTTMELLANFYKIERVYKGGQTMREITNVHRKRAQKLDRNLDNAQSKLIRSANEENPFLDEGRLAGFLATKEINKNPNLNIVRILFIADTNTRINRILSRRIKQRESKITELSQELKRAYEQNADPKDVDNLLTQIMHLTSKKVTFYLVKQEEKERENYDIAQWRKVHPDLENVKDIFDPSLAKFVINPGRKIEIVENRKGPKFYDFAINTSNISVEETARQIHLQLVKLGKVEEINLKKFSQKK